MANKGSPFERTIAKWLSLWISEGEEDSWVWRTSQSGGRATQRAKKGEKTSGAYGDLTFTDQRASWFFKVFSMELKCGYPGAEISPLIDSKQKDPLLKQFWEQCERDRELGGSKWSMVVLKRDRKIPLVMISQEAFSSLDFLFGKFPNTVISFSNETMRVVIVQFDNFFDYIDPKTLKTISIEE